MFWPCCSLFPFRALLYFRHLYYFYEIMFSGRFYLFRALYLSCLNQQLPLERFYFTWSAFIFLGALLFIGALLFFLQSTFLFLHSAFLMLHSAFLKFSVWVSTCIFSLIVSQRAIYLFWYSYYFNSQVWSAYLLIWGVRLLMILCVSIVILILYKTSRFWPHV